MTETNFFFLRSPGQHEKGLHIKKDKLHFHHHKNDLKMPWSS